MANRFGKRLDGRTWWPLGLLVLIAAGAFHCNKTGGLNTNKAKLLIVNTASSRPALDIGDTTSDIQTHAFKSFLDSPVSYGFTSGTPDTRYLYQTLGKYYEAGVGVKPIQVRTSDGTVLSRGSTTFNYARNYTIFLFDDSVPKKDSVSLFILPDNIISTVDTFAYLRWLNFAPGSTYYNFVINSVRPDTALTGYIADTIYSNFLNYVGDDERISLYPFKKVHTGNYRVQIAQGYDSLRRPNNFITLPDSLHLLRDKSYTAFVQGYKDSTGNKKLRLRVIQHN